MAEFEESAKRTEKKLIGRVGLEKWVEKLEISLFWNTKINLIILIS